MSRRKLFTSSPCSNFVNDFSSNEGSPKDCSTPPYSKKTKSSCNKEKEMKEPPTVTKKIPESTEPHFVVEEQGSDSDSTSTSAVYTTLNQKLPYTKQEDELILNFVLHGQNIFKVSSILLWKQLEYKKKNPRRTYQSLKNRFLRNIKPNLFTTFSYLIKDDASVERILAKFPELKKTMGRKETLSGIKLRERKPPIVAENSISSTSRRETQGNLERTSQRVSDPDFIYCSCTQNKVQPVPKIRAEQVNQTEGVSNFERVKTTNPEVRLERLKLPETINRPERTARPKPVGFERIVKPQEVDRPERVARPPPVAQLESRSYLHFFTSPNYQRLVTVSNDGIKISVNFKSAEYPESPNPWKPLGIYQKFEKLQSSNKLVLCPACGNYNSPKESTQLKSNNQSDDLIYNSVESPKTTYENTKQSSSASESKREIPPKRRRLRSSTSSRCLEKISYSPNLLNDNSEDGKSVHLSPDMVGRLSDAFPESIRSSKVSSSPYSKKDVDVNKKKPQTRSSNSQKEANKVNTKAKKAAPANVSQSNSRSRKTAKPTREILQDSFEDSNHVYSNKKIVCTDEEALLLREYLKKQFGSISSNADLTAFFLESTLDAETPELSLDFEMESQNDKRDTETPSTTSSSLIQNMKKMLEKHLKEEEAQKTRG